LSSKESVFRESAQFPTGARLPQAEVVFAYKDFDHDLTAKAEVLEAVSNKNYHAEGKLPIKKMEIYLLKTVK
jgi:hypothetical protein